MPDLDAHPDAIKHAVIQLLRGGNAHLTPEQALDGMPAPERGRRPEDQPYSVWELLEHMRIGQEDILRYTLDPSWQSPPWPDGYWPDSRGGQRNEQSREIDDATWDLTRERFERDRSELIALVADPATDLAARLPHGGSRTYLRQALLAADHNAYHTGQIVTVRRALGAWHR